MGKLKTYRIFKLTTLLFLVTYVCCVLINIMVFPSRINMAYQASKITATDSEKHTIHDGNSNAKSQIRLMDRSVVNEIQSVQRPALLLLLFVFTAGILLAIYVSSTPPRAYLFNNKQYSYLAFRTFRI
jgi:hypothetical protein